MAPMAGNGQRGVVLVAVLWTVLLLAGIAGALVSLAFTESAIARSAERRARALALAEAGVAHGILKLFEPGAERPWHFDGTPYPVPFDGVTLAVSIQAEAGRVDLNEAPAALLEGVLRAAGAEAGRAGALAAAVVKARPHAGVEGLTALPGMNAGLLAALEPAVTVHAQAPDIDRFTAPRTALLALPGATAEAVDAWLAERAERQERARRQALEAGLGVPGLAGQAFTVSAEASLPDGTTATRRAVVRIAEDPAQPYWVLDWR